MFNISDLSHISVIISLYIVITSFVFNLGLKELTNHIKFIKIKDSKITAVISSVYFLFGALLSKNNASENSSITIMVAEFILILICYALLILVKRSLLDKQHSKLLNIKNKPLYNISLIFLSAFLLGVFGYLAPKDYLIYTSDSISFLSSTILYFCIYLLSLILSGIIYNFNYIFTLKKYTIISSIDSNLPFIKNKTITGYLICEESKGMIVKPWNHKAIYIRKDLIDLIIPIED